jgi:transcription antitermination factor NusG
LKKYRDEVEENKERKVANDEFKRSDQLVSIPREPEYEIRRPTQNVTVNVMRQNLRGRAMERSDSPVPFRDTSNDLLFSPRSGYDPKKLIIQKDEFEDLHQYAEKF